jgi:predicted nucleic acid-binding protein
VSRVVADASVVLKWLLREQGGETDVEPALRLLAAIREGEVTLIQPPHWLAEVAAVLARLSPRTADEDVGDLYAMEIPIADAPGIYLGACELARRTGQHLFDTLYHAVALESAETVLVTADERYYRSAVHFGGMIRLRDYP